MIKKMKQKFKLYLNKTDEENISVTNGRLKYTDSYQILSSSFDELVKTLVDNSQKALKKLKEEIFVIDEKRKIVRELETLIKEDRYNNDSIEDLGKE